MKHFAYYPKVEYSKELAVNLMVRGKIRDAILEKSALYYRYTIEDGDRPDILSTKYYGNPSYTWAIFYANNMFHPIHDWPMTEFYFSKYLESKYGSVDNTYRGPPHHYEYVDQEKNVYIIDKKTYDLYKADQDYPKEVKEISFFEYEHRLNENRRQIVILDNAYLATITNELKNLFK